MMPAAVVTVPTLDNWSKEDDAYVRYDDVDTLSSSLDNATS